MAGPSPTTLARRTTGLPVLTMARDVKAWTKMVRDLEKAKREYNNVTEAAMRVVTKWLMRQVKTGITRSAPGGRPLMPNTRATIIRKRSARPLLDTGTLRKAIMQKVSRRGKVVTGAVGVRKWVPHPKGRGKTVARIATFHEFGFRHVGAGRFLRRRFLLPVLIRESPEIQKLFARAFSAGAARRMRIRGPIRPKIVRGIVRA